MIHGQRVLVAHQQTPRQPHPVPLPPCSNSKIVNNLLTKQPQPQPNPKLDFATPIKINQRLPDALLRSYSEILKNNSSYNPEKIGSINSRDQKVKETNSSRFSNYGSSSLSKLQMVSSDREVYEKQRKGRENDIISQTPREYVDSIKVFPKIRFERYDQDYWRRKSFIEGLPQQAYNLYSGNQPSEGAKLASMRTNSTLFTQK